MSLSVYEELPRKRVARERRSGVFFNRSSYIARERVVCRRAAMALGLEDMAAVFFHVYRWYSPRIICVRTARAVCVGASSGGGMSGRQMQHNDGVCTEDMQDDQQTPWLLAGGRHSTGTIIRW